MSVRVTADHVGMRYWNSIMKSNHELSAPTDFTRKRIMCDEYIITVSANARIRETDEAGPDHIVPPK